MKACRVIKANGAISNIGEVERQLQLWLNDATNGEYTLVFERAKKPRSNEQNKLMWVWFNCIAKSWTEATGRAFTPQNVHDAYCQLFLPVSTPHGNIPGSTSKLTVEEMTEFLNKVQADAASEYGISLISINDPFYAIWSMQYQ